MRTKNWIYCDRTAVCWGSGEGAQPVWPDYEKKKLKLAGSTVYFNCFLPVRVFMVGFHHFMYPACERYEPRRLEKGTCNTYLSLRLNKESGITRWPKHARYPHACALWNLNCSVQNFPKGTVRHSVGLLWLSPNLSRVYCGRVQKYGKVLSEFTEDKSVGERFKWCCHTMAETVTVYDRLLLANNR